MVHKYDKILINLFNVSFGRERSEFSISAQFYLWNTIWVGTSNATSIKSSNLKSILNHLLGCVKCIVFRYQNDTNPYDVIKHDTYIQQRAPSARLVSVNLTFNRHACVHSLKLSIMSILAVFPIFHAIRWHWKRLRVSNGNCYCVLAWQLTVMCIFAYVDTYICL